MQFLVTGGAGFIGSHLVRSLLKRGHAVRVIDNLSTGKRENLEEVLPDIDFMEGDIRSASVMEAAARGVEVILHQAALPSVPRSIQDPIASAEVNVLGTLQVLQAARASGVRRVVFASSSSVYGNTPELPKHEGMTPNPLSPYAVTKLSAEQFCRVFTGVYGLETTSLRYFNVFGPRQDPHSQYSAVIPRFATAILQSQRPVIFGDGEQSRDFTYVENVVEANYLAATAAYTPGLAMNCACHDRTTLNTLVQMLNEILGTAIVPEYAGPRPGDVRHSYAAIDLASRELGYHPTVEFRVGLERTVAWYRERR